MSGGDPSAGATAGIEDWRKLVATTLKGGDPASLRSRTRDGITIEPLYARRRDVRPLAGRGARRWSIVQPVDDPDIDRANAQALEDVAGGATALSLRFAPTAGSSLPFSAAALRGVLEKIDLAKVALRLEPHARILESTRWVQDHVAASGVAPELADIAFGLDPVAGMVAGETQPDPRQFAAAFEELRAARFRGPLAILDARPFHEAGASEAQELAGFLAAAAWWLRALGDAGFAPTGALPFLGVSVAVDRDVLLSIAKLRAARLLWARFQELCATPATPLQIHAETSRRMLTRADPPANLLRNTIAAFAAAVGGADAITVLPHIAALGLPDRNARALARNIQHILIEESHVYRVADPAAGAGALEALTDGLCENAWAEFQSIEREGGLIESIRAGAFPARIGAARAALIDEVARGVAPLVGATIHRSSETEPHATRAAPKGASIGLAPISLEAAVEAA